MSSTASSESGEGEKPNQNYYQDHNAGGLPDQGQHFVMPAVPSQRHGYQRYQQNQMQQQGYQQPYQQQYPQQQYQQYQPHSQAPPYQQHAQPPQPYGGYAARQEYGYQPQMYKPSYQYRGLLQQYMQRDTVTFPQPSQPPKTPAPAEKRARKLFEIVDLNKKNAIEVTPLQAPTAPVIPAVPLGPEEEKKKAELSRELTEQVRQRLTSTNTDDGHQSKSPNLQGSGPLPNFSQPPPSISSSQPVAEVGPEVTQPAPKTPDAQTKAETVATPAQPVTPVSSPQSSETTNTTPASGTAESAVTGHEARVTPTLQKEESKEEDDDDKFDEVDRNETPDLTESQIEKTPEELEEEKAQKEAEEKEKRRIREESLEKKLEELVASGDANIEKGYFARDFMITMRALEKEFARTPCPLSQQQLNDFGLDIKTMAIPQNKKTNFTPQWMPNNKGNRQQNPYRGRTTTDGTGRGGQQQRDRGGHNKRPPPVRASIERIPRVTLASSKDAWKPDRQKTAEDISAEEAAVKEVCKKVKIGILKRIAVFPDYYDHNAGAVPDQGQGQFVMPVVPPQGHGYQRYQQNQMQQQGYQQPYQQQYPQQQYQQYQPHSQAPPYQQHAQPPQPYGGYAGRQEYGHQPQMYNQGYQYRGPPQQYTQNDTVKSVQPTQPPMTAPALAEKRENATVQDDDHQPPIQKKLTPSTKDELMELVRAMAHAIVNLQKQNAQLITEVGTLTNAFVDLKKTMEGTPTTKETFAEMLNQGLSAPSAQVTIMNAAKLAQKSDDRQSSVIIRGAQLSTDLSQDNDLGRSVATECNISGNFSVFRIPLKESPPLLKIQFKNKMDANKALASFNSIKARVPGCHSASIRPDLSKPELAKFRESWKEAIEKNNEAGQRIWTVRNLETVKVPYEDGQSPHPWIVRNQ